MAKIIVLDDVLDAGVMIKRILSRRGHEVESFTEEEDALSYVRDNPVDIAILDIKLKKMSGVEVLEEMKKVSPSTRVIMLTGYPTLETAREAQKLGAFEYCVKPIDKDELEEKVAIALEESE
ncbi:response regulator [Desulfohalovibrio reitneri]|uniref:response regulator n=1 Tax=Desulfohalovibrio reitneri TaxID=1307759 RepID=UPI0004A758A4|nr:response regulator [Desulfohalovibrio reitneri]